MADIKEFNREKSASSAVGTPGIDTSGASLAESLGGVANKLLDIQIKKQQILDNVESANQSVDLSTASTQLAQSIHKNYIGSPKSAQEEADDVKSQLNKLYQDQYSKIKSPGAKAKFAVEGYKIIGQKSVDAFNQANKRKSLEAFQSLTQKDNEILNGISSTFADPILPLKEKMKVFHEQHDLLSQRAEAAKGLLSLEEATKHNAGLAKSLAIATISGTIEGNPQQARDLLNSGEFNDELKPEEIAKFRKEADAREKFLENRQKQERDKLYSKQYSDIFTKIANNELSLSQIRDITSEDDGLQESALRAYFKEHPPTAKETVADTMRLTSQYEKLIDLTGDLATGKTIEDLIKFKQDATEAWIKSSIHKDTLLTFISKLTPALDDAVAEIENGNTKSPPVRNLQAIQAVLKTTNNWLEQQKRPNDDPAKLNILQEFVEELPRIDPNDPEQVKTAIDKAISRQRLIENPILNTVKGTPNAILDQSSLRKNIQQGESNTKVDKSASSQNFEIIRNKKTGENFKVPYKDDGTLDYAKREKVE